MPEFAAEPGDSASLVIELGMLAWPTPFEINFVRHGWHHDDMGTPRVLQAVMG
jgi:hypothetical protein